MILAAIISFLAAFLLVRYKVIVATHEERQVERHIHHKDKGDPPTSKSFDGMNRTERAAHDVLSAGVDINRNTDPVPGMIRIFSRHDPDRSVYSKNPHIVQVGLFDSYPPTHLLNRCHNLCIFLTVLGFVLALTGILCFAWDRLPLSVGISTSFFMAVCLIAGLYVLLKPETKGKNSHIYCER